MGVRAEKWWFGGLVTLLVGIATVLAMLYINEKKQEFDERRLEFERDARQRELELEVERLDAQRAIAERDAVQERSSHALEQLKDIVGKLLRENGRLSPAEEQTVRRDVRKIEREIGAAPPSCPDAQSCNQMGLELSRKAQTEHSPAAHVEAIRFFDRACELGELAGCVNQAGVLVRGPCEIQDHTRARELFKKACVRGRKTACSALAALYWKGQGGDVDLKLSRAFAQRGCYLGDRDGCDIVADIDKGRLDAPSAIALKQNGSDCSAN